MKEKSVSSILNWVNTQERRAGRERERCGNVMKTTWKQILETWQRTFKTWEGAQTFNRNALRIMANLLELHIIIIIIIIISHRQRGSPWTSPSTLLYRPLLPIGLQGYILYLHRAVTCSFKLVVLPLLVHVKRFTEYVTCEFLLTSPAVFRMSGLSNLDSFRDGW